MSVHEDRHLDSEMEQMTPCFPVTCHTSDCLTSGRDCHAPGFNDRHPVVRGFCHLIRQFLACVFHETGICFLACP